MPAFIDRTGQRYNRLTAIRLLGQQGRRLLWECLCDCGKITNVVGEALSAGNTKSCGCAKRDATIARNKRMKTHGMTNTPEFYIWQGIKQRCYRPKYPQYHRYGGRGITVCDRWRSSFVNFLADMGKRPSPQHQLDRKDNDGNYEPNNCRWATPAAQCNNRSTTVYLTLDGLRKPVGVWSKVFGVSSYMILNRIKSGWTVERAVTQPIKKRRHG